MSAQSGPDEAARLEMALARIARAVSRPRVPASVAVGTLQDGTLQVGAAQDGTLRDAAAQNGTLQDGAGQVGAGQDRAGRGGAALHEGAGRATQPAALDAAVVAARLDKLIGEIRALLGPHEF